MVTTEVTTTITLNSQDRQQNIFTPINPPVSFIHLSGLCMQALEGSVLMSLKACVVTSEHLRPTAVRGIASCWKCKGTVPSPMCHIFPWVSDKNPGGMGLACLLMLFCTKYKQTVLASALALQKSIWDKWT